MFCCARAHTDRNNSVSAYKQRSYLVADLICLAKFDRCRVTLNFESEPDLQWACPLRGMVFRHAQRAGA